MMAHFQFTWSMFRGDQSINYFRSMVLLKNPSFKATPDRFFLGLPIYMEGIPFTGRFACLLLLE